MPRTLHSVGSVLADLARAIESNELDALASEVASALGEDDVVRNLEDARRRAAS